MNPEQKKTNEFFDKLINKGISRPLSWIGIGIGVLILMALSLIPAQDVYLMGEDNASLAPAWMCMDIFVMLKLRTHPYEVYSENQASRQVTEILQYHPINPQAIRKMKRFYQVRFVAKVMIGALGMQIIGALLNYGMISWMNFMHILVFVMVFPLTAVFVMDGLMQRLARES